MHFNYFKCTHLHSFLWQLIPHNQHLCENITLQFPFKCFPSHLQSTPFSFRPSSPVKKTCWISLTSREVRCASPWLLSMYWAHEFAIINSLHCYPPPPHWKLACGLPNVPFWILNRICILYYPLCHRAIYRQENILKVSQKLTCLWNQPHLFSPFLEEETLYTIFVTTILCCMHGFAL